MDKKAKAQDKRARRNKRKLMGGLRATEEPQNTDSDPDPANSTLNEANPSS
jgi:hypothetical protein